MSLKYAKMQQIFPLYTSLILGCQPYDYSKLTGL